MALRRKENRWGGRGMRLEGRAREMTMVTSVAQGSETKCRSC